MPKIELSDFDHVLDVSHHQGFFDAQKTKKSGVAGVYHKACEWFWWRTNPRYEDPTWNDRARAISDAGMYLGAYVFYRSRDRKPIEQAEWFREVVGEHPVDFVVIDVERNELSDKVAYTRDLVAHTKKVEELFQVKPWFYTRKTFWDYHVSPKVSYPWHEHPLIAAHYNQWISAPWVPSAWTNANEREILWQITERHRRDGVSYPVDLNLITQSEKFFKLMGEEMPPTLDERVSILETEVCRLDERVAELETHRT